MKRWQFYSEVIDLVRADHRNNNALIGGGHDFAHALMVAQYADAISEEPVATLAWIAGICHNTDRLFPSFSEEELDRQVMEYLLRTNLSVLEMQIVCEAVRKHSRKPCDSDNPTTVVLKDADKLANLGTLHVIRCAQFQPNLPALDLRYLQERPPGTSYKAPGSIYWDIMGSLEWEQPGWIKTAKAKELAKPLFCSLRAILEGMVAQFEATGLVPYPFPDDFA